MVHLRYVLNYRDPKTGRRLQPSFDRKGDAEAARNDAVATVEGVVKGIDALRPQ
jgi:hypothetical protein